MEGNWRCWLGTVTLLTKTDVVIVVGLAHSSSKANCEWRRQHQQYTAQGCLLLTAVCVCGCWWEGSGDATLWLLNCFFLTMLPAPALETPVIFFLLNFTMTVGVLFKINV